MTLQERDKVRLLHILDAIETIEFFIGDGSRDEKTEVAVIHELQIIGEAARCLSDELKEKYNSIAWHEMVGMRHIIVHEYTNLEPSIIWNAVEYDIPRLKADIEKIIKE